MTNLEKRLEDKNQLPEIWWRYVDDVFSIVKKHILPQTLETINKAHKNIEFTYEVEQDNKLPFLDLLIVKEHSSLTFEIYRKPTNTQRIIPNTSNHSHQHKMSSFNHMIHRLLTIPLSETGRRKELNYIFETGQLKAPSHYPERHYPERHYPERHYPEWVTTPKAITPNATTPDEPLPRKV